MDRISALRRLGMLQCALGVTLLVPPTWFLAHTRPKLTAVAERSQIDGTAITERLDRATLAMTNSHVTLEMMGARVAEVAALLRRMPALGHLAPKVDAMGAGCTNLAGAMLANAGGLRSTVRIVRETPAAVLAARETTTAISVVALLAGLVVILSGLQVVLLAPKCPPGIESQPGPLPGERQKV